MARLKHRLYQKWTKLLPSPHALQQTGAAVNPNKEKIVNKPSKFGQEAEKKNLKNQQQNLLRGRVEKNTLSAQCTCTYWQIIT